MATFNTPVDGAVGLQLASNYVSGSGSLALKSGQGAFFTTFPTIVTVITNSSYNTGAGEVLCEYVVTGKTTDTLTGATAVSGFTDQNFSTNDYVEGRVSAKYITDLNTAVGAGGSGTVTSVATGGGLTGGPITTTGTVSISPIANHAILSNISGGTAAPSGNTTTTVLDDGVGNVAGSFAIRGASVWGVGSKFNFDNTNTCPQWTAQADPSPPAVGDTWFSTTAGDLVTCRALDGSNNALVTMRDGTFFRCGACTALASFTTAASLLGSPANSWGSLTIPANALKVGQIIQIEFNGVYGVTGTPTFTFVIKLGATSIVSSQALAPSAGTVTSQFLTMSYSPTQLIFTAVGSGGTVQPELFVGTYSAAGSLVSYLAGPGGASTGSGTPIAIATNAALAIDFTVACSASASANTLQILSGNVKLIG